DMLEKHNVQVLTSTALQEVHPDHFVVKRNEQMETLDFDYGFVCLGMRAYSPVMEELKQTFADEDVELFNIGDSVRARRIIDGVAEGRNILNALKQKEFL
ncbi:TPA: 2,4-dienoyl-CoA reductase, partial [Clostridioides difficile]